MAEAFTVLPHDSYSRQFGLFVGDKLPWVLGANIAGEVTEIGAGVSKVKVGDHVFGLENIAATLPDGGGLQEYALLDQDALAIVPDGFTDDEAVTLPINAVTSFMAFFTQYGFNFPAPWTEEAKSYDFTSENVVIIAAGSNVGKLGVQFAKLVGIGKIICIAGLNNTEELMSYGATHVVDRHGSNEEVAAQIHQITGENGVTKVYDCYSWTYELGLDILTATKPSHLVTLHSHKGNTPDMIKTKRPLAAAKYVACHNQGLAPYTEDFWEHLVMALKARKVFPTTFRTIEGLDVDKINEALDIYWTAKPQKQVIVHP